MKKKKIELLLERYYKQSIQRHNMQVRVKENANEIGKCGCGRSPTGKCIGWHGLSESQFQSRLAEYMAEEQNKEDEFKDGSGT
jgi:hypothetical protein